MQQPRIVLTTGRYIGEGFDDPRLGTLVLAMPIAWGGTMTQYAGRLQRHHAAERESEFGGEAGELSHAMPRSAWSHARTTERPRRRVIARPARCHGLILRRRSSHVYTTARGI